jgi:hypothetical protein
MAVDGLTWEEAEKRLERVDVVLAESMVESLPRYRRLKR